MSEPLQIPIEDAPVPHVTAALHRPEGRRWGAPVLLTHGAGGDLDNVGLIALADLLAGLGHPVIRANLPYREAGRRGAPRAESNVAHVRRMLTSASDVTGLTGPWIAGGKSYGGRVASLYAAEDDGATLLGLLFYGYPLHPPGRPESLRVDHWPRIPVPCLFLQGTRDPFCDAGLLEQHVHKLPRRATIRMVEGGDHSLKVTGAASPTGEPSNVANTIWALRDPIRAWLGSLET